MMAGSFYTIHSAWELRRSSTDRVLALSWDLVIDRSRSFPSQICHTLSPISKLHKEMPQAKLQLSDMGRGQGPHSQTDVALWVSMGVKWQPETNSSVLESVGRECGG